MPRVETFVHIQEILDIHMNRTDDIGYQVERILYRHLGQEIPLLTMLAQTLHVCADVIVELLYIIP